MSADVQRIKVSCPNCEKRLVVKAELAGRRVKCPQCQTPFTATAAGDTAEVAVAETATVRKPEPPTAETPLAKSTPSAKPRSWKPPPSDDDEPATPKKRRKKKSSSNGAGVLGPGLIRGVVFGVIAAVVSAAGWALVGALTGMEIGWLAWGVGVLCGIAVAMGCQDADTLQGVVAAGCAVGGVLLGKFMLLYFVIIPEAAQKVGVPVELMKETLATVGGYGELFTKMFSPMDLLFIGLAVISAFKLGSGSSSSD